MRGRRNKALNVLSCHSPGASPSLQNDLLLPFFVKVAALSVDKVLHYMVGKLGSGLFYNFTALLHHVPQAWPGADVPHNLVHKIQMVGTSVVLLGFL